MLPFLSITGISLFLIIINFNGKKSPSFIYLGVFFFLISLYALYQYILLYSKSVILVSLFLLNIAINSSPLYLIGPMLYWYIRSVLTDNAKLGRRDLWHLVPMIIFFIAALPHAFVPWPEKVEAARTVVADPGFMGVYRATLLAQIFTPALEYLTRPLLVIGYTLWSAGIFIQYLIKKKASRVLSKQHFMKKWLFLFLGFLLILEVAQILLIIRAFEMHFSDLFFTLNVMRILSGVGLIGLMISPFFFPEILYGLPRFPESTLHRKPEEGESDPLSRDFKTYTLNFESEYIHHIGQQADSCMKEYQLYLHPDFNLAQLSVQIHIPVHHLAFYFREIRKQTFHDFRNEWRISYAKKLILEGKTSEMTLEAIGIMSGFSNRDSFRITFEKMEGISPHAFACSIQHKSLTYPNVFA
jgi:AraC-like DNA-binding protein